MADISVAPLVSAPQADPLCSDINREENYCEGPHHDITEQIQNAEETYVVRDWAMDKLNQIKAASSLQVHTRILPESVKVAKNIVSVEIVTYLNRTGTLEFLFFEGGIVKLNCVNPGNPSKFSFELIEKPANLTPYVVENNVTVTDKQIEVTLAETQAKFVVELNPFTFKVISTKNAQKEEMLFEMNTNKSLMFDDNLTADFTFYNEYLYGLAEHASDLLLADTKSDLPYRFCNQDIPTYPLDCKNGLYGSIPLIISRSRTSSTLVSMYWQNASDTYIDIHKADTSSNAYWLSERGNLECYIFVSHSNASHFKSLSDVFGHCAMPQYFSLGYHQCRWSYKDQADVMHVNAKFNEHQIPCDTITLDIDHTDGCRYFTWNEKLFPNPLAMQKALADDKRQLVTIADPHIKVDDQYHVYKEAIEKGLCVKTNEGKPFVGTCWPGDSIWLDFMNEETRQNWASQYSYEKYKQSSSNVWAWNDMNEPSVFGFKGNHMPLENIHTVKSLAEPEKVVEVEHREAHNLYGYGQHKATYEGMIKRNKDENIRPHVLSRSFYAGSQKWTTIWTGDTGATWEYLKMTVPQLLSLSLCGISFCGGDVGGFIGDPEPELATRWYQLGTFMPYFRAHSEINTKRREPWLLEKKYFDIVKESIKERYRLLPYWYTCFEEHCRTAIPILRPVWFDQTYVSETDNMKDQERFMVGDGLLVVPILEANKTSIQGALKGLEGRWYDYYSKKEILDGEEIQTGLEKIGCFVKGGNIIPTFDIRSYVKSSQDAKDSNINILIAVDEEDNAEGKMYFDDGETFNYKKGSFNRKTIQFQKNILTWKNDQEEGCEYTHINRVTRAVIMGLNSKAENAYLVEEGKKKKKIQVVKGAGYVVLEFVAIVDKNWQIVLE